MQTSPLSLQPIVADMLKKLGKALLLSAFIAYPILLHTFILRDAIEAWRLLLVFTPLLIVASWMILRSVRKIWWPLGALLLAALIYYVVTGAHGKVGLLAVNGLAHATLNLFLLWLFGRTLLRGREPLITQIASHIKGQLTPDVALYTRQATIAWCVFFTLQVVTSLSLYAFAPVAVWSLFINVLDLPLLALMFIAENTYRTLRFPHHSRTPIMKVIEVYTKNYAAPKKAEKKS